MVKTDKYCKYSVCRILYKIDNTAGWYMAEKSGSKEECTKICNEFIAQKKWSDFKCWEDAFHVEPIDVPLRVCRIGAYDLHLRTNLIFNTFDEKFYYPDEIIPYKQKRNLRTCNIFKLEAKVEPFNDKDGYLNDILSDKEDFQDVSARLYINNKFGIIVVAQDVMEDIPLFLKKLEQNEYSNLIIEEYWYTKFLAWKRGNKIRFVVQNCGGDEEEIVFDKFIDEKIFFEEFNQLYCQIKEGLEKVKLLYKQFKKEEAYLRLLSWQFDSKNKEKLQEYINIDKHRKSKIFKNFIDKVKNNSSRHTINFNDGTQDYCMRQEDYYYKICNGKLIRYFRYSSYKKETLRYIKLYNVSIAPNTKIMDLYKDMVAHSGRHAITCYLGKNEAIIYEDGGIEAPKSSMEEINELKNIIKKIVKENNKTAFTVDEFCLLLEENDVRLGARFGIAKMCIKEDLLEH